MKKLICLMLVMMLALCACAPQSSNETTANTTEGTSATTGSTAATNGSTGATTSAADRLKALAESCIDKSVQELFALIGEPESAEYVTSCLGPGEDGNLFYDGFIVYTYREGNTETVTYVE